MGKSKTIVVHAAIDRKAICKFTKDDPKDWPKRVWWVHPKAKKYKDRITCKKCLRKMKESN